MKKSITPCKYESLTLRPLLKEDLPHTLIWRNHDHHRMWFNSTKILTLAEHQQWFRDYLQKENDFIFIITDEHGNLIGQLSIYNVDFENKSATFGRFLVNPLFSGQGFMKKAALAAIQLAKEVMRLDSLSLEVKVTNAKAIHIYESCGFMRKNNVNGMLTMSISL